MNKFIQFLIIIAVTFPASCGAQQYYEANGYSERRPLEYLPDTIKYRQPRIDTVSSINDIKGNYKIIDSITNPEGYILKSLAESNTPQHISIGGQSIYILAIKQANKFLTFPILSPDQFDFGEIHTERIFFGDSIEKKLKVSYTFNHGFPFNDKGDSYNEYGEGFQLWDLKDIKILFRFRNYYTYKRWDNYKLITKDCLCENIDTKIIGQEIKLKELTVCNEHADSLENSNKTPATATYYWTPSRLIKRK